VIKEFYVIWISILLIYSCSLKHYRLTLWGCRKLPKALVLSGAIALIAIASGVGRFDALAIIIAVEPEEKPSDNDKKPPVF
jgi:hypothetical protein